MSEATDRKRLTKQLRAGLHELGIACGIPIVVSGDKFVLPKNDSRQMRLVRHFVDSMTGENVDSSNAAAPETAERVRNSFVVSRRGSKKRTLVEIIDASPRADGSERVLHRAHGVHEYEVERLNFHLHTFVVGSRIVYESEVEALRKLKTLVGPDDYERYVVTGMLRAEGKSGTLYLIRKSRPTLAFTKGEHPKVLCVLCMHPLGYFANSWIGAMPPTDEVIAHLLMIRGDEHYFWRKANQIPFAEPNSGI